MVQARSSPLLKLSLTPMRIAEVAPQDELSSILAPGIATESLADTTSLVVYPGEPSEMVVQIKNVSRHTIALALNVQGNFPADWVQLGTEGHELRPQEYMDAVLYFQIPTSFFEDHSAVRPDQPDLNLKYHVLIVAQASSQETDRHLYQSEFDLYVRPRSLYLDFLPALYREVDFIGRFMKIFEQGFEPIVQSLDAMWAHLDPLTAPEALLPFLAHWVGWKIEPGISVDRQRRLIRQAVELYRWRGTRRGLRLYLHWYTGLPIDEHLPDEFEKHISITEPFGGAFIVGDTTLAETAVLGGGQPYHFCVRLRADQSLDEALIRRIIEQEKPAFCTYDLAIDSITH
ncbi:phage tail protein [Cyanobacteria bacterium FACHB-63]|nr:phage tail protein [Cyanobacteria bacterium FACHB-63]